MEEPKELNGELKAVVNKRFEDLFKLIGNNRQQLATKVSSVQRDLIRTLNKEKVDAAGEVRMLAEVTKTEKMAAQQLPHHLLPPKPVADKPVVTPKPVVEKKAVPAKPAPEKKAPEKKIEKKADKKVEAKAAPQKVVKKAISKSAAKAPAKKKK